MQRSHSATRKRHRREAQETGRRLTVAPRRAAPERCRPGDCPRAGGLRRTHHGQHGARNHAEASGVRLEPAVAVSSSLKRNLSSQGFTLMAPVPLYDRVVEPAPHAHANESAPQPGSFGVPHAARGAIAGHSLGSSSSPLERRRRLANLCPRAFSAVALQSVLGCRKRTSGVGIGARIGR
jgi:hypothetical protein